MYNSGTSREINTWISILCGAGVLPWPAKGASSFHPVMSIQPNPPPLSSSAVGRMGRQAGALQHRSPLHCTEGTANFRSRKVLVRTMGKLKPHLGMSTPLWKLNENVWGLVEFGVTTRKQGQPQSYSNWQVYVALTALSNGDIRSLFTFLGNAHHQKGTALAIATELLQVLRFRWKVKFLVSIFTRITF